MRLLSCTCHQSILGGLVVGAWLTLFLVARGSGALSGVLVKVGGGALRLAVAGDVVQLCIPEWLLPVDSTVIVSCVEGLITCVLAGNCQGEGHVWLAVLVVGVAVCSVHFCSECARCSSLRRQATRFRITVHPW